jgi:uncharacterized protein (DUF1684 family)
MRFLPILAVVLLPLAVSAAGPGPGSYEKWRADREASLRAPDGWLSVAGLLWLHEGENTVELPAGASQKTIALRLDGSKVTFEKRQLKSDITEHPDVLTLGNVTLTIIERGGKTGVRLRDPNAETRRDFTGCKWFPADTAWRVQAKWVAYPKPKTIAITNILGMTDQEPSPGYAEFTLQGKTMRLEPVLEDGELFFMFKDATSAKTTYGAGRFLYAGLPKGDTVELDFNKATNPPCAFTAFATCPLPPKQNILTAAVDAGEKSYGKH